MLSHSAIFALLLVLGSGLEEEMWGPSDGVKAFGMVEKALEKITKMHYMSPEESKKAHHVADDVRKAIAVVESGSNLTKAQRNAKIGEVMKELTDLKGDMLKDTGLTMDDQAKAKKLAELKSELAEKKKELEKDEAMIKLYTLQKELAEKKLMLEKLIEKKNQAKESKQAVAEDAKEESALVGKLMKLTGSLAKVTDKKAALPAPLKEALSEVQNRTKKESDMLTNMENTNKETMTALDAELKKSLPTKGKDDALKKGQSMIARLKKEEHRAFMKSKVQKQNQINELKAIEQSIEQHDAKKLTTTLLKMQHESKAEAAKSGDFLH